MHYVFVHFIGRLPPPENVTIRSKNSTTIHLDWNTPYFTRNSLSDAVHEINNKSDVVHVNPHITQYTVYISSSAGRNITRNVTEAQYIFRDSLTTKNDLCSNFTFSISAWSAGNEGEMSEPVQGSLLHGKFNVNSLLLTHKSSEFRVITEVHHSFIIICSSTQYSNTKHQCFSHRRICSTLPCRGTLQFGLW